MALQGRRQSGCGLLQAEATGVSQGHRSVGHGEPWRVSSKVGPVRFLFGKKEVLVLNYGGLGGKVWLEMGR